MLVYKAAPYSLNLFIVVPLFDNSFAQAKMGLLRSHIMDGRVVMLVIIPVKVFAHIFSGLLVIDKETGILRKGAKRVGP